MAGASQLGSDRTRVFLSHAGADAVAARAFAEILRRNGVDVWFDRDSLQPGDRWMAALEEAIERSSAMVIYVGRLGVQNWVDREVRYGLELNTRDPKAFKLIPVFGDGADINRLPPFLSQQQGIAVNDLEAIQRLLNVLRGGEDKPAVPSEYWATHSPFRSLQAFDPDDAWLFFGRDRDTSELLERLHDSRVLVVIGNSGSGKSSLVRAGLIPALQRGRFCVDGKVVDSWRVAVVQPGIDPFGELVDHLPRQLAPGLSPSDRDALITRWRKTFPEGGNAVRNGIAAVSTEHGRTLLFIDQFEELFTLAPERVRERYIDAVLSTVESEGVHLILGLRADFYANCLTHETLKPHLQRNYSLLLMKPEQLREAIEKRLTLGGTRAEEGLTDALLADAGTEPGNLALLEHALAQLWERNIGKYASAPLTNKRYDEIGRLKGAIGKHAQAVYSGLTPEQQVLAKRIFLELVHLGEGAQDTRRRVSKATLLTLSEPETAAPLLEVLASKRLIATSGAQAGAQTGFVEVSHEALIREWSDLRHWVDENREDLRFERRLATDADDWDRAKEPGALLRGARLVKAKEWLAKYPHAATTVHAFVDASDAEEEDAQAAKLRQERQLREAAEAREKAEREGYKKLRRAFALLTAAVVALLVAGSWAWYQTRASRREADLSRRTLAASHLREATARLIAGRQTEALSFYAAAIRLDPSNPVIQTATLEALRTARWALVSFQHGDRVSSAAFSADGTRVVTASWDKTARVWDAQTGQPVGAPLQHGGAVSSAAFSADGTRVVTASVDGTARVWDARTGQPVGAPLQHGAGVSSAAFSVDGTRVVTASRDKTARVWDVRTGQPVGAPLQHGDYVSSAAFSADGTRVVTASWDKTVRVWDARTGQPVGAPLQHGAVVSSAAFSADGTRAVTASGDATARVWDARTGQPVTAPLQHGDYVYSAAFSADGTRVVTASGDGTARVWDARTAQPVGTPLQHGDYVSSAVFSADGTRVVTASHDKTARVWDARTGQPVGAPLQHGAGVSSAAFSADGTRVVTASGDGTARVWDARTGQPVGAPLQHGAGVSSAAFSADGTRVVTASEDKTARVWDARTGQPVGAPLQHGGAVFSAAFSADGTRVVTASGDKTVRVWDARTGQPVGAPLQHGDRVSSAAFSADGTRVVTASWDKTVRVWDARTGQPVGAPLQHGAVVSSAAFSADGTRVVTASEDKTARVWDARTGQPVGAPLQHGSGVFSAAFSVDGTRVVTASQDKTARVWDARTGQPVGAPLQHGDYVYSAAFSADGTRVVTASLDGTARVWDARTAQPVGTPLQHGDRVSSAAFSADGTRVVTASHDKTARVWDARTGQPLGAPLQHGAIVSSAAFSADGTRVVTASGDKTARVWDAMISISPDSGIISEVAEVLSGYSVNDAGGLVHVADVPARLMFLRQIVATARPGEPTGPSFLHWLFEDPWARTISPLSAISVNSYLAERLKQCTRAARSEAESHFLGHPLFLKIREFCPDAASSDTDGSAPRPGALRGAHREQKAHGSE